MLPSRSPTTRVTKYSPPITQRCLSYFSSTYWLKMRPFLLIGIVVFVFCYFLSEFSFHRHRLPELVPLVTDDIVIPRGAHVFGTLKQNSKESSSSSKKKKKKSPSTPVFVDPATLIGDHPEFKKHHAFPRTAETPSDAALQWFSPRCERQRDQPGFRIPPCTLASFKAQINATSSTQLITITRPTLAPTLRPDQPTEFKNHHYDPLPSSGHVLNQPTCYDHLSRLISLNPSTPVEARTTFDWAFFEWPFFMTDDEYDRSSRSIDLGFVSWYHNKLHIHGLDDDTRTKNVIPEFFPYYKTLQFDGSQNFHSLDEQVEFHSEALDLHSCQEWIEESTMFVAGWASSNMFHLHNDNIYPMFQHLRSLGLLHPSLPKRLYVFPPEQPPLPWWRTMEMMFNGNVHPIEELYNVWRPESKLCFRHIRWGRGPIIGWSRGHELLSSKCDTLPSLGVWPLTGQARRDFSLNDLPKTHWDKQYPLVAGDGIAYAQYWWRRFGLPERIRPFRNAEGGRLLGTEITADDEVDVEDDEYLACRQHQQQPSVVWFDRGGERRIANSDQVVEWMVELGVNVTRCCNWGDSPFPIEQHIRLLHSTDIIMAIHGAAFGYMSYMPAGGILVELVPVGWLWQSHIPRLGRTMDHLSVPIDLRAMNKEWGPVHMTRDFVTSCVGELRQQWRRHVSCTLEEERIRQKYYDKKVHTFTERYPMGDVLGDRVNLIDPISFRDE